MNPDFDFDFDEFVKKDLLPPLENDDTDALINPFGVFRGEFALHICFMDILPSVNVIEL